MENTAALCYANVVLQLVYHLPDVRQLLLDSRNETSDSPDSQAIFRELQEILRHLETSRTPGNASSLLALMNRPLNVSQDALEFFDDLFEEHLDMHNDEGEFFGPHLAELFRITLPGNMVSRVFHNYSLKVECDDQNCRNLFEICLHVLFQLMNLSATSCLEAFLPSLL